MDNVIAKKTVYALKPPVNIVSLFQITPNDKAEVESINANDADFLLDDRYSEVNQYIKTAKLSFQNSRRDNNPHFTLFGNNLDKKEVLFAENEYMYEQENTMN